MALTHLAEETKAAYSYVLAPQRITAGAVLRAGPEAPIAVGNTLPLASMPAGTQVPHWSDSPSR